MERSLLYRLRHIISVRTGLHLREQDDSKLVETINLRVKLSGLSSAEEYCRFLESDTERTKTEQQKLTGCLTTSETYFFRDKGQFTLLEIAILPELIKKRKDKKTFRIWSAGCSTGEEAYSIAILLDEFAREVEGWDILILGTDINEAAIEKAKKGHYGEWSFRQMTDEIKRRYFHKVKNGWEIDERIKKMARFEVMNLITDIYPDYGRDIHDMDLILCRNVFIYFNPDVVFKAASKMADILNDGGYLMTGHAELQRQDMPSLKIRVFPESVVYQKSLERPNAELGVRIAELKSEYRIQKPEVRIPQPHFHPAGVGLGKVFKTQIPKSKIEDAKTYANMGRYDDAITCCKDAIKAEPFSPEPYHILAQIACEKGDVETEKEMLKKVIYLDPSSAAGFLELAVIYANKGDAAKAQKMRVTALELLKKMTPDAVVEPYTFTAGELIEHIEKMI